LGIDFFGKDLPKRFSGGAIAGGGLLEAVDFVISRASERKFS